MTWFGTWLLTSTAQGAVLWPGHKVRPSGRLLLWIFIDDIASSHTEYTSYLLLDCNEGRIVPFCSHHWEDKKDGLSHQHIMLCELQVTSGMRTRLSQTAVMTAQNTEKWLWRFRGEEERAYLWTEREALCSVVWEQGSCHVTLLKSTVARCERGRGGEEAYPKVSPRTLHKLRQNIWSPLHLSSLLMPYTQNQIWTSPGLSTACWDE